MTQEQIFHAAWRAHPEDDAVRGAYADYLEENNLADADYIQNLRVPGVDYLVIRFELRSYIERLNMDEPVPEGLLQPTPFLDTKKRLMGWVIDKVVNYRSLCIDAKGVVGVGFRVDMHQTNYPGTLDLKRTIWL